MPKHSASFNVDWDAFRVFYKPVKANDEHEITHTSTHLQELYYEETIRYEIWSRRKGAVMSAPKPNFAFHPSALKDFQEESNCRYE
jgi:hypothetical protein